MAETTRHNHSNAHPHAHAIQTRRSKRLSEGGAGAAPMIDENDAPITHAVANVKPAAAAVAAAVVAKPLKPVAAAAPAPVPALASGKPTTAPVTIVEQKLASTAQSRTVLSDISHKTASTLNAAPAPHHKRQKSGESKAPIAAAAAAAAVAPAVTRTLRSHKTAAAAEPVAPAAEEEEEEEESSSQHRRKRQSLGDGRSCEPMFDEDAEIDAFDVDGASSATAAASEHKHASTSGGGAKPNRNKRTSAQMLDDNTTAAAAAAAAENAENVAPAAAAKAIESIRIVDDDATTSAAGAGSESDESEQLSLVRTKSAVAQRIQPPTASSSSSSASVVVIVPSNANAYAAAQPQHRSTAASMVDHKLDNKYAAGAGAAGAVDAKVAAVQKSSALLQATLRVGSTGTAAAASSSAAAAVALTPLAAAKAAFLAAHANCGMNAPCSEYAHDIDYHLRQAETKHLVRSDYMEQIQHDINHTMRSILVDWLIEVAEEYNLHAPTLFLTVNYIDRMLAKVAVSRVKLQLIGVTCMLIACKYEEMYPPTVDDFVYISDSTYKREEVLKMEALLLTALGFNLTVTTPTEFLVRYAHLALCDPRTTHLSHFFLEMMLQEPVYLKYRPSMWAAAALWLAMATAQPLQRPDWSRVLVEATGYHAEQLRDVISALNGVHHRVLSEGATLKAVREKYSQEKYHNVSTIKPITLQ